MSAEQPTHFVQGFTQGISHLVQQGASVFRDFVDVEMVGSGDRHFFDQIGATVALKRTERHAVTEYSDTPMARRMAIMTPYDVADLVDVPDKIRVLNDPTNSISQSFAMAMLRTIDDVIIEAAVGNAFTGVDGTTVTPGNTPKAGTVITLDNLLTIKQQFDEDDVPKDERHIVLHPQGLRDLLDDVDQVRNADYVTVKALVQGEVDTFLGMMFHTSNRLQLDGSGQQRCFAWHKSGIKLVLAQNPMGRITEIPERRFSTQVFYSMDIGATRMEEAKVVEQLLNA